MPYPIKLPHPILKSGFCLLELVQEFFPFFGFRVPLFPFFSISTFNGADSALVLLF